MWEKVHSDCNAGNWWRTRVRFSGPARRAEQAYGEVGSDRMLEADEPLEREVIAFLQPKETRRAACGADRRTDLSRRSTRCAVSPSSSGKRLQTLARACVHAGAEVVLVRQPGEDPGAARGVRQIRVPALSEMRSAVFGGSARPISSSALPRSPTIDRRTRRSLIKKSGNEMLITADAQPGRPR